MPDALCAEYVPRFTSRSLRRFANAKLQNIYDICKCFEKKSAISVQYLVLFEPYPQYLWYQHAQNGNELPVSDFLFAGDAHTLAAYLLVLLR